MAFDLNTMTRKELEALRRRIDTALARALKQDLKAGKAAAEKALKPYGLSLEDVTDGKSGAPAPKRKNAAKPKNPGTPRYADPADATRTWTGKGRRPDWFVKSVAAGKTPEDLEI